MDEIKSEAVEETTAVTQESAEETTEVTEENGGTEKKKRKLPQWLQKLVDKIQANEDVRQMVLFTLFSMICGASQLIITYLLSLLRLASGTILAEKFVGLPVGSINIFAYDSTGEFIGFLVGSIVGQVLTFVLNRKKTFKATNNLAVSITMYVILALFIIFMQTLLGGAITKACWNAKPDATEFLALLYNLAGQAVAGIAALIISFLGNKFLVMRDWGKKKREKEALQAEASVEEDSDKQ